MTIYDRDGTVLFTLWAPNAPGESMRYDTGDAATPSEHAGAEWPRDAGMTRDEWFTECCKSAVMLLRGRGWDAARAECFGSEWSISTAQAA